MAECQPHQFKAPDIFLLSDLSKIPTLIDEFLSQIHCITALTKKVAFIDRTSLNSAPPNRRKKLLVRTLSALSLPGWCIERKQHYGLCDRLSRKESEVLYTQRQLLGVKKNLSF
ncbi:phage regulatory CII family protein [Enterobacter asburiae]|nr:phage regulatory CII family protein [Enterobacter asburiae]